MKTVKGLMQVALCGLISTSALVAQAVESRNEDTGRLEISYNMVCSGRGTYGSYTYYIDTIDGQAWVSEDKGSHGVNILTIKYEQVQYDARHGIVTGRNLKSYEPDLELDIKNAPGLKCAFLKKRQFTGINSHQYDDLSRRR